MKLVIVPLYGLKPKGFWRWILFSLNQALQSNYSLTVSSKWLIKIRYLKMERLLSELCWHISPSIPLPSSPDTGPIALQPKLHLKRLLQASYLVKLNWLDYFCNKQEYSSIKSCLYPGGGGGGGSWERGGYSVDISVGVNCWDSEALTPYQATFSCILPPYCSLDTRNRCRFLVLMINNQAVLPRENQLSTKIPR